jgi:hypothetical protein
VAGACAGCAAWGVGVGWERADLYASTQDNESGSFTKALGAQEEIEEAGCIQENVHLDRHCKAGRWFRGEAMGCAQRTEGGGGGEGRGSRVIGTRSEWVRGAWGQARRKQKIGE